MSGQIYFLLETATEYVYSVSTAGCWSILTIRARFQARHISGTHRCRLLRPGTLDPWVPLRSGTRRIAGSHWGARTWGEQQPGR